jgi:hypothetical protein
MLTLFAIYLTFAAIVFIISVIVEGTKNLGSLALLSIFWPAVAAAILVSEWERLK